MEYRLADATVAQLVESLSVLAGPPPARERVLLMEARTCYDHLAGRLGVALFDGLVASGALRDDSDDLVVSLSADDGVLRASLGPFAPEKVHATDSDGGLDLRRVLETVCDTHEIEERDDGAWVELTKRIATAGTQA